MKRWMLLVWGVGCTGPAIGDEDPVTAACDQAAGDRGQAVTASTTRDDAPILGLGQGYVVTPSDLGETWVALDVTRADVDVTLLAGQAAVVDALFDGDEDLLGASAPVDACPDAIGAHWDLALRGPATFPIRLSPTVNPTVWLSAVQSGDHAD